MLNIDEASFVDYDKEAATTHYGWECNNTVVIDNGYTVIISGINVWEDDDGDVTSIAVYYFWEDDDELVLYDDDAFCEAVSELLGYLVQFTEMGEQDVGVASMELA